jgi:hypothetical protein
MVAIFLFTLFVELIKNDLLVMQILKKRLRPYLIGHGTETSVSCADLFNYVSFSGFVSIRICLNLLD